MILKGQHSELLEIKILQRLNANTNDYWDGNWLTSEINIEVAGFTAHYKACLRVEDFQNFLKGTINVQNHTADKVEFITMEGGLYLSFKLQKTGVLICSGKSTDAGNSLEFNFSLDNIALNYLANQCEDILKEYPLIGQS